MLAYRAREHSEKSQTLGITIIRKNGMQEDQEGSKDNNIRAEEEQVIAVARTKQHKEEEGGTGMRLAGRENKGAKRVTKAKKRRKNENGTSNQDNKTKCHYCRFRAPPIELKRKHTWQKLPL